MSCDRDRRRVYVSNRKRFMRIGFGVSYKGTALATGVLIGTFVIGRTLAQESQATGSDSLAAVKAEIQLDTRLYTPERPILVRFLLHNRSDEPVEIGTVRTSRDSVGLPMELVLGSADEAGLHLTYEREKPVRMRPAERPAEDELRRLTLAPRASVGTQIDLRDFYRQIRYAGLYKLEWRPFGGKIGTATAEFRVEPRKDVIIITDYGKLTFRLMYDEAPRNVENFLELVRDGFYAGTTFHRVVADFWIQGGRPLGTGTGTGAGVRPDGKLIAAELHSAPFDVGTLAMAHKPDDPDSASCQFFVTLSRIEELDGQYSVIGQSEDDETVRTLQQISSQRTDNRNQPVRPITIRSVEAVPRDVHMRSRLRVGERK